MNDSRSRLALMTRPVMIVCIVVLSCLLLFGCGGGGSSDGISAGGGGGTGGTTPADTGGDDGSSGGTVSTANPILIDPVFSPSTAKSGTLITMTVSFDFIDADMNLSGGKFYICFNGMEQYECSISCGDTMGGSGQAMFLDVMVPGPAGGMGVATLDMWMEDSTGLPSNRVQDTFVLTP